MIEGAAVGLGGNSGRARRGRGGGRGGGIEGGGGAGGTAGIVLELEHRRKSGRPMGEWFYLSLDHHRHHNKNHHYKNNKRTKPSSPPTTTAASSATSSNISLLEDHPLYKLSEKVHNNTDNLNPDDIEHDTPQTTFDLNLTERQKKARDEVILPYFDAQKEEGYGHGGGGGRILFTPGREDDFDEEEDEI